ncbi:MAG TPA: GAF domain-containing protein [Anaerolineales bacterium]|nr:GAF domain-containing protein [Anaerolineales bacterium]
MKRIAAAITRWFLSLTYPRKFNVITVIFLLPIIAFIPLIRNQTERIDRYGTHELFGTLYLRSLWNLTDAIQHHQAVSLSYLNGDADFSEVRAAQGLVDAEFENYKFVQSQEILSAEFRAEEESIASLWTALKGSIRDSAPEEALNAHSKILDEISLLVSRVGDYSYLILDPDLDTYYTMDAVLLNLPQNQALLTESRAIINSYGGEGTLTSDDEIRLRILAETLATRLASMDRNISVAVQNTTTPAITSLGSAFVEYRTANAAVIDTLNRLSSNPQLSDNAVRESNEIFDTARSASLSFYNASSEGLQKGVAARINSLVLQFYVIALVALVSVVSAFLLGQNIMNSISKPLFQLAETSQKIAVGDLTARVPVESSDEVGKVASAFNQMADELEAEKAAIISRSRELEAANQTSTQRAQDLQSIGEISKVITSEHKLDTLLPLITNLVSEKFKFYHVGIFLLDDRNENVVLEATNSEGGKKMLSRAHRLQVGSGIVGYVAATSLPRIALDVGSDSVFFNNPDLPQTRSEMAVPLRVSEVTIGVLDVQSTEPNAFNDDDISTLATLADQVAIAIQNSRNFETAQRLIEHAQQTSGLVMKESWQAIKSQSQLLSYRASSPGISRKDAQVAPEVLEKIKADRKPVVLEGNNFQLAVPIQLSNNVVGVLNIRLPENHTPDQDEIDIARAVGDRLSLALESTTLLEAAQRRAEYERMTSDISTKIGASTRFESILRTAAEELSQALGGSDVLVQIQPSAAGTTSERGDHGGARSPNAEDRRSHEQ